MIAKLATGFTPGPDDTIIDVETVNPQWGDVVGEWHAVLLETTSHWRVVPDAPRLIFTNDDSQTLNGVDPYMAHARALKTIANFFEARRKAGKAFPVPFFMTAPPQHSAKKIGGSGVCGSPGRVLNQQEIEKMLRTNVQLSRYWPMQRAAFPEGSAVRRFDITLPVKYLDCLHWCQPGVPDIWSLLRGVMLPPFSSSSPRALNGERLRCANSCGVSLLAARPTSRMPARAGPVSAAGRASNRVRATVGEGSERGGRLEGRKLTRAEGRRAEGFDAEERRREAGRWGSRTKPQRQGEWRRTEEGGKAGSKGSRQRFVGYADDVAAEDRLRQEAGGAVDWLTRPSNGDAGGHSARSGEWDTGKGRGDGPADWESGWDGDGEEQGARGERGGWGEESGGAGRGRARGVQGWMGDGNVERVRRFGAERGQGDEGWRVVEYGETWRRGDGDGWGSTDGSMDTGMVGGDRSTRLQQQNREQQQQQKQRQQQRVPKQLPQSSPPQQQLQLQPLSSQSSPLAPIPSSSPPAPLRESSPSPASSPRPLPSVLPLPPSALDSLLPFAGSGSQVVAFMGSPLDWLQRFVLSMGGAVLCYNVNVFATIAAAMYFLWWPLWHAAACNSALRIRYKYAGVWQARLLDVQVEQRGPLARWRLLIGDDSGTCIEMLVPIPSPPPPLRRSDRVVLLVLSDSPSLIRFRAVREAWVPRLKCWLAEEGEERVERRMLEGL
ncbi:unnamed protein product [Closterium sp. Naga37s-1]|nr:unnamed protein product [Closterium sp. Naga37s-1]